MVNHPNRKRERLCKYGSCHSTDVRVTVHVLGDPSERPAFCCADHAGMWLLRQFNVHLSPQPYDEQAILARSPEQ